MGVLDYLEGKVKSGANAILSQVQQHAVAPIENAGSNFVKGDTGWQKAAQNYLNTGFGNGIDAAYGRFQSGKALPDLVEAPSAEYARAHPVLGLLGSVGAGAANFLPTLFNQSANIGTDIGNAVSNGKSTAYGRLLSSPGKLVGQVAGIPGAPQDALSFAKNAAGTAAYGANFLFPGAAESGIAAEAAVPSVLRQAGISALEGAKVGAGQGGLSGFSDSQSGSFGGSAIDAAKGAALGAAGGAVLGASGPLTKGLAGGASKVARDTGDYQGLAKATHTFQAEVPTTETSLVDGVPVTRPAELQKIVVSEPQAESILRQHDGIPAQVIDHTEGGPRVEITLDSNRNVVSWQPDRYEFYKDLYGSATRGSHLGDSRKPGYVGNGEGVAPAGKMAPISKDAAQAAEKQIYDRELSNFSPTRVEPTKGEVSNGFADTVRNSEKTDAFIKEAAAGTHDVRSTDDLAMRARTLVKEDISAAKSLVNNGTDDKAVAVAMELIKHYQEAKDFDSALDVINVISPKLTEAGRAVQAAAIYNRLTPEGVLRFAQRELEKGAKEGQPLPKLTPEQAAGFVEQAKAIQEMPEGRDRNLATQKMLEAISELVPTPLLKKVVTAWKAGLLTGLKTIGVNDSANATFGIGEILKDVPATAIDSVASLFTGKKTTSLSLRGGRGFYEGVIKAWDHLTTGIDDGVNRLDYQRVNFGKGPIAQLLQGAVEGVFRTMGASDKPFFYFAHAHSLYKQAGAEAINKGLSGSERKAFIDSFVSNPPDGAVKAAFQDAAYATFQNKTKLGELAKALQHSGGGLGEIIVPFGKTPSAAAMSLLDYTPVGAAKTLIQNIGKGKFDQKAFSEGIGRSITGTAAAAVGVALAAKGLITGAAPTDQATRDRWELEGKKPNSILIGGKWRSIQPFGTAGMAMVVGALFHDKLQETGSPTQAAIASTVGMGKVVTDQSFLKGVSGAINAVNDPTRYANTFFESTVGSLVPTQVADIAASTDPLQRQTNSPLDALEARVPGLRTSLLPKQDALGNDVQRSTNGLQTYLDPFRPSDAKSSSTVDELSRLAASGNEATPGKLNKSQTVGGQKVSLDPAQLYAEQQKAGQQIQSLYSKVLADPAYQALGDEQKKKVLDQIAQNAQAAAKLNANAAQLTPEALNQAFRSLSKDQAALLGNNASYSVSLPKQDSSPLPLTLQQTQAQLAAAAGYAPGAQSSAQVSAQKNLNPYLDSLTPSGSSVSSARGLSLKGVKSSSGRSRTRKAAHAPHAKASRGVSGLLKARLPKARRPTAGKARASKKISLTKKI